MTLSPSDTVEKAREDWDGIHTYIDQELRHLESEQFHMSQELHQLRNRNAWLTGAVLTLFLGLGGLVTWLILDNHPTQQADSSGDAAPFETPIGSRVQQLEQEIAALQQQIPADLTAAMSVNQGAIRQLEAQLQQLISKLNTLQLDPSSIDTPEQSSELDEIEGDESAPRQSSQSRSIEAPKIDDALQQKP